MTAPTKKRPGRGQTALLVVSALLQAAVATYLYESPSTSQRLTDIGVGAVGYSAVITLALAIAVSRRR